MRFLAIVLVTAMPAALFAQPPAAYYRGIVNSADFAGAGLPGGGIAQGSIFSIFGTGLGPAQGVQVSSLPLQTTFQNVSIKLIQGATQVNAYPVYGSSSIINAIMPSNAPLGMVSLQVTYNNAVGKLSPIKVVKNSFHVYSLNGSGRGPGATVNINADGTGSINSLQNPANPGQIVVVYGTGLGPVTGGDNVTPPAGNLPVQFEAWVGGVSAKVLYSGRASPGEDQINLTIPSNVPLGCWVPVYFRVGGAITSNSTTIAISNGGACSDAANPLSQTFIKGGKLGTMRLFHSSTVENIAVVKAGTVTSDLFLTDYSQVAASPFGFSSLFSQPPAGSCNVFFVKGDIWSARGGGFGDVSTVTRRLDSGVPATLSGPGGPISISPGTNLLGQPLGSAATMLPTLGDHTVLKAGTNTLTSNGGADVPAYQTTLTFPAPFTLNEQTTLDTVSRVQPLTLTWTGLPAGQTMLILGGNADLPSNSSAVFYCASPPGTTSFTILPEVLGAIPAARADGRQSKGMVQLTNSALSNGSVATIPGLDSAVAIGYSVAGKTVIFQ